MYEFLRKRYTATSAVWRCILQFASVVAIVKCMALLIHWIDPEITSTRGYILSGIIGIVILCVVGVIGALLWFGLRAWYRWNYFRATMVWEKRHQVRE